MLVLRSQIQTNISTHDEHYKFYDTNCTCPTCKQDIEEDVKKDEQDRLRLKLDELETGLNTLDDQIKKHQNLLAEFNEIRNNLNKVNSDIRVYRNDVRALVEKMASNHFEILDLKKGDSILKEQYTTKEATEKEIEQITEQQKKLLDEKLMITTAADLLKDGGIKTKIVRQYIPIINKTINKYLAAMGFLTHFELDETFEETIKARHRDEFSYESFSEGEKCRIDMALMLAWRAIAKTKNSASTNLLILDEVFDSSLDDDGIDELMKITKGLTSDTNLFIISHKKDQMLDKFQRVLVSSKKKNFSFVEEV